MLSSQLDVTVQRCSAPPLVGLPTPVATCLCDSSSSKGGCGLPAECVDLTAPPDCSHCPAGTEPAVGFEYKWWNTLPTNMETTVLSGINFEYKGMTGNCLPPDCELSALPQGLFPPHVSS